MSELCSAFMKHGALIHDWLDWKYEEFKTPDDLFDFFSVDLNKLLSSSKDEEDLDSDLVLLDPKSTFGIFLRRVLVTFQKLMFERISKLFEDIKKYRDEHYEPELDRTRLPHCPFSYAQVARHVEHECSVLEHKFGTRSPFETESKAQALLKMAPDVPHPYLLRHFNCSQHLELEGAIDSLHRYIDTCAISPLPRDPSTASSASASSSIQHAILTLVALHFRFGQFDQALQALDETVRLAQNSNDHGCLVHALAWLARMSSDSSGMQQKMFRRCIARAQELQLPQLASLCSLTLAKESLYSIRRIGFPGSRDSFSQATRPLQVHESINMSILNATPTDAAGSIIGSSHLVTACSWSVFGSAPMSALHNDLYLRFYADSGAAEDAVVAACNLALQLYDRGSHEQCVQLLTETRSKFHVNVHPILLRAIGHVLFQNALNRCQLQEAKSIQTQLLALSPPKIDKAAYLDARYKDAQIMAAYGQFAETAEALHKIIDESDTEELQMYGTKHRILLANVHLSAGSPVTALVEILRCITAAETFNQDTERAEAFVVLANTRLCLGHSVEAFKHLQEVMTQLLAHASLLVRGSAHKAQALCHLALADPVNPDPKALQQAMECLRDAEADFRLMHALEHLKEVHQLQALTANRMNDIPSRDAAAKSFRALAERVASNKFGTTHDGVAVTLAGLGMAQLSLCRQVQAPAPAPAASTQSRRSSRYYFGRRDDCSLREVLAP